tara:strand:+ start:215 stop:451 length:237 start_codon:yes stop_codon:yes gene_type:complete
MLKNTENNRESIASLIVECWNQADLVSYAIHALAKEYDTDLQQFNEDVAHLVEHDGESVLDGLELAASATDIFETEGC